jgi:hypothetical protein
VSSEQKLVAGLKKLATKTRLHESKSITQKFTMGRQPEKIPEAPKKEKGNRHNDKLRELRRKWSSNVAMP